MLVDVTKRSCRVEFGSGRGSKRVIFKQVAGQTGLTHFAMSTLDSLVFFSLKPLLFSH